MALLSCWGEVTTENEHEVIENRVQEKGETEFLSSLTQVFSESVRILKDDGVFVFTFHHKSEAVWGTLLKVVLDSGLYVSAVYPVRSEMRASTHLHDTSNIIMDIVLVCRKRMKLVESREWKDIQQLVVQHTQFLVTNLELSGESFSFLDVYMLGFGKYLELYSKHYPHVYDDGASIGIKESIESIRQLVSEHVNTS